MLGMRLSVVSIGTRDIDQLTEFYESLGWKTDFATDGFALINLAGAPLALYSLDHLAVELGTTAEAIDDGGAYGRHIPGVLLDSPDEVDVVHREIEKSGAQLRTKPAIQPWGVRNFYFTDPEGNLWEVAHMPGITFGTQDAAIWPLR